MKRIRLLFRSIQKIGDPFMFPAMHDAVPAGTLAYKSEHNCLMLDGHELQRGERIEIRVFDAWLPGEVAMDAGGWYLITDQVEIRLHSGLPARIYEAPLSTSAALRPAQSQPPRVLIVDDDVALLEALPRTVALRLPTAHVDTCSSAQAALALLHQQRYDAIVSDIKMPAMDGLELLAQIREVQPETPTLLITGHGEHELAIRALRGGAYDYIQKPIERDNFIAALLRAIQTCQLRRQVAEQQRALEMHARSLERLVQQRTQELVEAHAAKDKVIGLVSHELHSPLTHLKEITQLLQQKIGAMAGTEIVQQSFSEIADSLAQTEKLVQSLERASHIETSLFMLHREPCDLVALCYEIVREITLGTHAQLSWDCPGGPLTVEIDRALIRQVLQTLLADVREPGSDDALIKIMVHHTRHDAIIVVRGLSSRTHLSIDFHIARKILEQHAGHLDMQSFPANQRTVFITLPLATHDLSTDVTTRPHIHAIGEVSYQE